MSSAASKWTAKPYCKPLGKFFDEQNIEHQSEYGAGYALNIT
jgi:hypothetical protein